VSAALSDPLPANAWRGLIVEDLADDAELIALRLEAEGFVVRWTRVETESDYLDALAAGPDLILADWHLPRFSGLRALQLLRERDPVTPFIIVSGGIGEESAVDALRQGANDYVLKDRPARLGLAVRRALDDARQSVERRRTEEKLRQVACVFESTSEGIVLADAQARILAVNRAFTEITGYRESEVLGQNPRILQSGRHDPAFYRALWSELLATGQWRGEVWNRRKDGEVYPEWLNLSAVRDAAGNTTHYVAVFSDVGHIKRTQQALDFLVHHDPLTKLPNRALFRDRLEHGLQRARRSAKQLALLLLDLDRFKVVNDTLGHPLGDALLRAIAERLRAATSESDTLARLGGDELALLLEDDASAQNAAFAARRLQALFAQPLALGEHELVVTASIGISLFPFDGDDADTLIRHAERAMYEAKTLGRNTYRFFGPGLAAGVLDTLVMESALRVAVTRGQLVLHYQPQVDMGSGALLGVEALVRWCHPDLGLVSPGRFIPLAEEIGVIGEIGNWVLTEACGQMAAWDAQGLAVPRVAVNLSVQQIERGDLVRIVSETLGAAGLAPGRLELEVTESLIMREPERAQAVLRDLMDLGVQIAVDDFGTGYSSLSYIKRLSLDRLKIDRSFVGDIGVDVGSEAIVRAVIALARSLGLETVAEGVEREDQAALLRREGCEIAQGYLYGYPVSGSELLAGWAGRAVGVRESPGRHDGLDEYNGNGATSIP
jgi:diguanylate cyclase (GGDEF)-like protein/PAS domain S-box-containing protein